MDNFHRNSSDKESSDQKASNTEWLPTKCRITKPPPPKPATNPLQFIKVNPCPLFQKAKEQIKKVEEIKIMRQDIKDEPEDWQQNLDNWKSSRRKRQEHIIERVVEVKKFEQEEQQRGRRKSKTFSEILEERDKRGHRVTLPIYDEDSNYLSDYGIGSSSSRANSVRDVDTDDSSSILDDKDQNSDSQSSKDVLSASNQSQSEDELCSVRNLVDNENNLINCEKEKETSISLKDSTSSNSKKIIENEEKLNSQQYTYEGAIEDYRSRIKSKIKMDDSVFNKVKDSEESQKLIPKVDVYKRKEIFEFEKPVEISHFESTTSRRLSEDFANSQSIRERLKSLEKCTEQPLKSVGKSGSPVNSIKSRINSLNKQNEGDNKNNNVQSSGQNSKSISYYLIEDKSSIKSLKEDTERYSSPEAELYMNKLNLFNQDLNNLLGNGVEDYCNSEIIGSSDREDSGIHTADVSCSVSQADEPVEDLISTTIEKLKQEKELQKEIKVDVPTPQENVKTIIVKTQEFLDDVRQNSDFVSSTCNGTLNCSQSKDKPIYENVEIKSFDAVDDTFSNFIFPPAKKIEPPKEKPPPPPPSDSENFDKPKETSVKRINSTKRIKKELNIKRSSFLGLEEPSNYLLDPDVTLELPPDINTFLKKESQLEKTFYKKLQGSRDVCLSEVESQDSGLESEKGRLSSDTWCSSYRELNTPTHGRQDSELTNSVTSEEDEIAKKEREIIELIEKEEKRRDYTTNCEAYNLPHFSKQNSNFRFEDDQEDSEVLKVKHEILQLEREELERKRDNIILRDSSKIYRQNNRHSLDNICDSTESELTDYRKSMPDLPNSSTNCYKIAPERSYFYGEAHKDLYHKSMPDIQQAYLRKSIPLISKDKQSLTDHRKSMPELQDGPYVRSRQPIMPGKPLKSLVKEYREKERSAMMKMCESEKSITRPGLHALSAVPKSKHIPNDNWIQAKAPTENKKNYNQHWLYQEAELRRLADQQKNVSPKRSTNKQEKHIPEPIIQTLTQRVQSRVIQNDRNQQIRRPKNFVNDFTQHPYLSHSNTYGHASPVAYPPPPLEDSQGKMLSVSGKKKCSYCGNELGRGAAMIIESLCLFYHMECFKCCVCHAQLGDGLMGTDVRVRNQKLHCHNCYSSDDGVKFSCV